MKKIILTCLMAFVILQASAQIWVEGAVNFSGDKQKAETYKNSRNNINFEPTVGYDITDRVALGVALTYGHTFIGAEAYDMKLNTYGISPFVRYTFVQHDRLRFFVDGGCNYTRQAFKTSHNANFKEFSVFAVPGISYDINERIAIVGKMGNVSWMRNWYEGELNLTMFDVDLYSTLSLGFIVKL